MMSIDEIVAKLAAPTYNYRMASGLLADLDRHSSPERPDHKRLRKSAITRRANAEKAIREIIAHAAADDES